jgi:hypothetical protein
MVIRFDAMETLIFLINDNHVQASANTILSHFLGLSSSLELLRSVTEAAPVPKPA